MQINFTKKQLFILLGSIILAFSIVIFWARKDTPGAKTDWEIAQTNLSDVNLTSLETSWGQPNSLLGGHYDEYFFNPEGASMDHRVVFDEGELVHVRIVFKDEILMQEDIEAEFGPPTHTYISEKFYGIATVWGYPELGKEFYIFPNGLVKDARLFNPLPTDTYKKFVGEYGQYY